MSREKEELLRFPLEQTGILCYTTLQCKNGVLANKPKFVLFLTCAALVQKKDKRAK